MKSGKKIDEVEKSWKINVLFAEQGVHFSCLYPENYDFNMIAGVNAGAKSVEDVLLNVYLWEVAL